MRKEWGDDFTCLRKDDTHWLSSSQEVYAISEMDFSYLMNTLRMLRRHEKTNNTKYQIPDLMIERIEEYRETNPEYFL